ncbi:MAG: polyphenol oxidase family protein [bacterium]|nr:polyphenol oxidase family protein [bacterium]
MPNSKASLNLSIHWKNFIQNDPIQVGFSSISDGCMSFYRGKKEQVIQNRESYFSKFYIQLKDTCWASLVHGDQVAFVQETDRSKGALSNPTAISKTDGMWTTTKNLTLCTTHADCIPMYCYSSENSAVGIAHCGWRSIVKKLPEKMILKAIEHFHCTLPSFRILLGVGICSNCFEVSKEIVHLFPENTITIIDEKYFVDLNLCITQQLQNVGLDNSQIIVTNLCSRCSSEYPSYRRDREKVQPAVAWIRTY